MQTHKLNKPVDCIANICLNHEKNGEDCNYHFFVNSVDFIGKVIRKAKLSTDLVRVVCSQSRENGNKNQAKLGAEYQIAEPLDPVKRFNFYTSTAFEGCDIYDKKGRVVVINDGNVPHTLIDIGTLFAQIAGRLRDSDYRGHIIHIYSTTNRKTDDTLDNFMEATNDEYNDAVKFAERINKRNTREDIKELHTEKRYVRTTNEGLVVDRNLLNSDIVQYKLRNELYSAKINVECELSKSYDITDNTAYYVTDSLPLESNPRTSFKELFIRYCELKANEQPYYMGLPDREIDLIERNKPIIKEAYAKLGQSEVERLDYNLTSIKRELAKRLDDSQTAKIIRFINNEIPHHKAMPNSQIKRMLQEIYGELGIKRTAKATDLDQWFHTMLTTPKINGKSTVCTVIVRSKVIVYREAEQQQLFDNEEDL